MTNPDLFPNVAPAESRDRRRRRWDRARTVRTACTIVNFVCGLFAVMLVVNVIMVMGGANPANGVASFVRGFAGAVSLGFGGLFTPTSMKAQVLLNDGSAAIVWLVLGAVVTVLIRRFALPGPRGLMRWN